jgi:hypothetical protein
MGNKNKKRKNRFVREIYKLYIYIYIKRKQNWINNKDNVVVSDLTILNCYYHQQLFLFILHR